MYYNMKPGLVASYDLLPEKWNGPILEVDR